MTFKFDNDFQNVYFKCKNFIITLIYKISKFQRYFNCVIVIYLLILNRFNAFSHLFTIKSRIRNAYYKLDGNIKIDEIAMYLNYMQYLNQTKSR